MNKYGTKRTHPDDKAITAKPYTRYNKNKNATVTNNRFFKIGLLKQHPWAIYTKGSFESGPGLVKCGLCSIAKEKGCELWRGGKKTIEDKWVWGSDCWINMNRKEQWYKHEESVVHRTAIDFLYNESNSNIIINLQSTGKAYLTRCQEKKSILFCQCLNSSYQVSSQEIYGFLWF